MEECPGGTGREGDFNALSPQSVQKAWVNVQAAGTDEKPGVP